MSGDFKQKLRDYKDGKLSEEERTELERELEKMEAYQSFLDEMMDGEDRFGQKACPEESEAEKKKYKREARLLRKGKWKARIGTAFTLIGFFIGFTILCSIGTAIFYQAGDPGYEEINRDVVKSAFAVGYPNVVVQPSSNAGSYFNMKISGKMIKRVGDEHMEVGDFTANYWFEWLRLNHVEWKDMFSASKGYFQFPGYQGSDSSSEWKRLEKLPEGTVAEAYVSYKKLYSTDDFLKRFEGKPYDPLWFAVDNGDSNIKRDYGLVISPVGFPAIPVWHPGDGKVTEGPKRKVGWFVTMRSSSTSYPPIDTYGSGPLREENFIKSLHILNRHKKAAASLVPFVDFKETLDYIEKNGVKIYGAVVTGPTKEILKLKEDPEVSAIRIGEVALWNWRE
ncbi:anti sigma factor C-terminal domain-containing protein [Paenibacillus sp. VCA1]|uniref:anti-sigma factor n=1 Tax=Paenibacillus sp. VCA1 TaxID=3039148 RepID=UPI0028723AC4|nr:anti sigma factor C-terminal domain-containing protein [Paenibacillus sp. VCA1]MDR9855995.1 anti sigma factor C-terminal domain-containing protein [Paenibacillus sp. VCA1]